MNDRIDFRLDENI